MRQGRNLLLLLCGIVILFTTTGCRSSKRERTSSHQTEVKEQKNDIETSGKKELITEIKDIIQSVLSESMNFNKQEIEYDSDKPVLAETGKPPVKKETYTNASQKKEETKTQAETTNISENTIIAQVDKTQSSINQSNNSEIITEDNMQKESDIFLKWVGGISLLSVILVAIFYMIYKHLKKNRLV